jgi:hypothetical protein
MPNYQFKAHDVRTGSEKIGAAVLADDDEAVAFAKRVIRELIPLTPSYTLHGRWKSPRGSAASLASHSDLMQWRMGPAENYDLRSSLSRTTRSCGSFTLFI